MTYVNPAEKLALEDEWKNPHALAATFKRAMEGPNYVKLTAGDILTPSGNIVRKQK